MRNCRPLGKSHPRTSSAPAGGDGGADGVISKDRGELRLPFPDGLITEHDTANEEHLGQVAQSQPIAQTPEHPRATTSLGYGSGSARGTASVELLAAFAAAETAIALCRALRPLRHSRRTAAQTPHLHSRPSQRDGTLRGLLPTDQRSKTGAIPDRTSPSAGALRLSLARDTAAP